MRVLVHIGSHPRYRELIRYPPDGVNYVVRGRSDPKLYYSEKRTKKATNLLIKVLGIPRMAYYRTDADLIFTTRGVIPLNRKPWVGEIEQPYSFVGMDFHNWRWRQKSLVRWLLSRNNCKRIMPNTEAALHAVENSIDISRIRQKFEVVYTAIHYKEIKGVKHEGFNFLSVNSRDVYGKGFGIMRDIYPVLKHRYPQVNWTIRTDQEFMPEDQAFIDKFNVKIIRGNLDEEGMNRLYARTDVLVHPSFADSDAVVVLEAMRAGVPSVTTDIFAFPEKITSYVNGFTIHCPELLVNRRFLKIDNPRFDPKTYHNKKMSRELYNALEYFIRNPKERKRMGENGRRMIKDGKFSIKQRNAKLREIFEEAIGK